MSDDLHALLRKAAQVKMTCCEYARQRVDFAYGNLAIDRPELTSAAFWSYLSDKDRTCKCGKPVEWKWREKDEDRATLSAVFCDHANEVPMVCPCVEECYCKQHTCQQT